VLCLLWDTLPGKFFLVELFGRNLSYPVSELIDNLFVFFGQGKDAQQIGFCNRCVMFAVGHTARKVFFSGIIWEKFNLPCLKVDR
jgi:hypothetical protein